MEGRGGEQNCGQLRRTVRHKYRRNSSYSIVRLPGLEQGASPPPDSSISAKKRGSSLSQPMGRHRCPSSTRVRHLGNSPPAVHGGMGRVLGRHRIRLLYPLRECLVVLKCLPCRTLSRFGKWVREAKGMLGFALVSEHLSRNIAAVTKLVGMSAEGVQSEAIDPVGTASGNMPHT